MELSLDNEPLRDWYRERGFGGRVGFGERPALLVVDVGRGWLDPGTPIGSPQEQVLESIVGIVRAAREAQIPRFFTTMGFEPNLADAGDVFVRKLPLAHMHIVGSAEMELHPSLGRTESELLIVKPRQSAFFGTSVLGHLVGLGIDTVVVVGLSTSACVRSTCEDAFNHNFRVIVPREAVGDRCEPWHEAALFDIDNRFGDVVSEATVRIYLASQPVTPEGPG